jgi:hypothetical protein
VLSRCYFHGEDTPKPGTCLPEIQTLIVLLLLVPSGKSGTEDKCTIRQTTGKRYAGTHLGDLQYTQISEPLLLITRVVCSSRPRSCETYLVPHPSLMSLVYRLFSPDYYKSILDSATA